MLDAPARSSPLFSLRVSPPPLSAVCRHTINMPPPGSPSPHFPHPYNQTSYPYSQNQTGCPYSQNQTGYVHPQNQTGDFDPNWRQNPLNFTFPDILWTAVAISTSFAVLYGASSTQRSHSQRPSRPRALTRHCSSTGLFLTLAVVSAYLLLLVLPPHRNLNTKSLIDPCRMHYVPLAAGASTGRSPRYSSSRSQRSWYRRRRTGPSSSCSASAGSSRTPARSLFAPTGRRSSHRSAWGPRR